MLERREECLWGPNIGLPHIPQSLPQKPYNPSNHRAIAPHPYTIITKTPKPHFTHTKPHSTSEPLLSPASFLCVSSLAQPCCAHPFCAFIDCWKRSYFLTSAADTDLRACIQRTQRRERDLSIILCCKQFHLQRASVRAKRVYACTCMCMCVRVRVAPAQHLMVHNWVIKYQNQERIEFVHPCQECTCVRVCLRVCVGGGGGGVCVWVGKRACRRGGSISVPW